MRLTDDNHFSRLCVNSDYFDIFAHKQMLDGMIEQTVEEVDLPPRQMIFRFSSTLQEEFPASCDKGSGSYDESAMNKFLIKVSQDKVSKRRIAGCWWLRDAHMANLKFFSFEDNIPLSAVARKALIIKNKWSNVDYLVCARVKPGIWLGAYEGKGREQFETLKDGSRKHWPENPDMEQLYIPGLESLPNIHAWLVLDHVQMIRT
ncbi:hypothetical protein [endosymbiont of Ridgeia piscesae]|jgi:hypothetical protein|uniref:Uncharacterized protein n=1 Tax=endosymbiont of Ridgeia piscesae TaxID=54398 RepID=A0A0T5Z0W2_9GAMM|nr:hypothetical protein [endosymbiont of Ridgeia piscesae]KRT56429.1 hypothetical protein Ga0074115_1465 [endosymbiont of Ridgeia piscesae]KRT59047.1 hypothetical protein Ga0076813_14752 [endosymbiont of Ridgeia piscesae]